MVAEAAITSKDIEKMQRGINYIQHTLQLQQKQIQVNFDLI